MSESEEEAAGGEARRSAWLERQDFDVWALLGALAVFLALAWRYLAADLWFDELLTLLDYALPGHFWAIFQSYEVANNHVLFSALLWCWLRLTDSLDPVALRLPGLVMALLTGLLLYFHGRHLLGRGAGLLLLLVTLLSPVYLDFFYQLRGYGLTMLLSSVALICALCRVRGER